MDQAGSLPFSTALEAAERVLGIGRPFPLLSRAGPSHRKVHAHKWIVVRYIDRDNHKHWSSERAECRRRWAASAAFPPTVVRGRGHHGRSLTARSHQRASTPDGVRCAHAPPAHLPWATGSRRSRKCLLSIVSWPW